MVRSRRRPAAVAQKAQPCRQPTCDEMHSVVRVRALLAGVRLAGAAG